MTLTQLDAAFKTMHLRPPDNSCYMDTGSNSHLTNDPGNISHISHLSNQHSIQVGNGTNIPSLGRGFVTLSFPNHSYYLHNVFHVPKIIKNFVFVCKFTTDNLLSVEFDPFSFL